MTLFGIGTDICDVRRIAATLARRGERFPERVLGPAEMQIFHARRARSEARGVRFLATRFSAKEAFSKAAGLGIRTPMTWRACEILNHPSGAPYVRLHGALAQWCAVRGLQAWVSVTDETDYAASFVVLQRGAAGDPADPGGPARPAVLSDPRDP
jgi:holo-[acyl-carrier protein] synthase